jgi:glycosyltransferase involved in cell wall biosynthesis
MATAQVHVAIPVRWVGPWLDAALQSLQRQTLRDWTATLVVDSAPDEGDPCAEIAQAWAQREPRIRALLPGRVGLPAALNLATAGAGGAPLLARLDGDDLCHPERLAEQVQFLEAHPDIGVLDSRAESFRDAEAGPLPRGMLRYQQWHDRIESHADFVREFLVENPVCHPAVMMRRDLLGLLDDPEQPYRSGDFPEDYDLWLRLLGGGARFHKLPRRLLRWRDREDRATRTDAIYKRTAFFTAKWRSFQSRVLPGAGQIAVCGGGSESRRWIRALSEAGHLPVAVVDINPKAIGSTRHGAPVIALEGLPDYQPDLALIAVGTAGARTTLEAALEGMTIPHLAVAGITG